ncbi:MAG: ComEC/Rec2 family competence protein, partial [Muribaculaceae bacterium]|nr:ComEC/Rec2 family competence protein [Muribaculaceae bacterium]
LVSASSIIAGQRYECENIEALVFTPPGRRLYPGDEIAVSGLLRSFNDSVSSAYKLRFQAAKGPVLSIHSYSIPIIVGHSSGIMTWAYEVNERLSVYIDNTPLSPFSKGFIKSVILGNRGGMTHYDKSVFADAGVSHVLAVSGMHVGIICMILLSLTIPLQLFKSGFFIRYCICGIAIWLYVLLTGLSYSSIRATLMLSVVVIAILCGRKRSPISALFISTVLILLCDPHSLYSIGLWLSFSCVASIIIGTPVFNTIDISVHPRTHRVVSFLLTTLVATASTWMLSAYFFGVFPTHFLLANVVILPVLPLYVILSGTYLIFLPLLRLNSDLYYAATNLVDYPPRFLAEMLNVMSLDAVNVNIPLLSLVFYYAGLLLIFCTMFNKTDNTSEREYIRGDNASLPYELVSKPHTAATPRYIAGAILVIISILMI